MSKKRRLHSPGLKAKVALEALKGIEPVHTIAAKFEVHPVQMSQRKKMSERLPDVFARKANHNSEAVKVREKILFEEIGRLKMELECLKRSWRARALRSAADD